MEDREWVEEYAKLIISIDSDQRLKAIQLKNQHTPSKLYRYRPLHNLKHIQNELNGKIYLSHQNELNDPFDSRSILHSYKPTEFLHYDDHYTNELKHTVRTELHRYNPQIFTDDFFRLYFVFKDWYHPICDFCKKQNLGDDPILFLNSVIMSFAEKMNSKINELIEYDYRIACFTTCCMNSFMWHYYAGEHTGICLEYSTDLLPSLYRDSLFKVVYTTNLPDITYTIIQHSNFITNDFLRNALIYKFTDWHGEDEWRLIIHRKIFSPSSPSIFFDYPKKGEIINFIKPSKIILGARISNINKLNILNLATEYEIPVEQLDITQHGLKPKELRFDLDDLKNDEMYILQASNLTPSQEKLIDFSTSLPDKDIEKILHYLWFLKEENKTLTEKDL